MLGFKGVDNKSLLPPRARRRALLHGLHGHRQLAQRRPPEHAAADHGLAALLGHRVPRRRLPLRPGQRAGARALRRRPPVGASSTPSTRTRSSRRSSSSPSRGTSGPAATRSATSPCSGAEWNGIYRDVDARLLARAGRASATSPRASPARATSTSPTGASRSRRSTSSPPTTASRSPTSSPTTRSTTRRTRRTTATAPTTTARGTAASRARPTTRRSTRCARASSATSSRRCMLSQGVPMLLGGDELCRTQHGNNNAWCQDNEISWYEWDIGEEGQRLLDFTKRLIAPAPGPSGVPPPPLPQRRRDRRGPGCRTPGGSAPTAAG